MHFFALILLFAARKLAWAGHTVREIVDQLGVYVIINMKYCFTCHEILFDLVNSGENLVA